MTAIPTTMCNAGQGLGDAAGEPKLSDTLRDIADDLGDLQVAAITTPDAGGAYTANEQALLNEIKTALNTIAAATVRTTKASY